ncbi:hypothetical protein [Deinococcus humi]|uniref:Uncharacterized protein n=1 Tax=Deinococcus humi TaxID=662880 RepID=A0A7W8JTG6_9DEIO|nr:hypothetical protein [Deinococcus humi]MBB5362854.1 hypothetical protein [Deinococcus humi]GGO25958.1 hypothetical protein GCM10008949_16260 [Deinococcus humi]
MRTFRRIAALSLVLTLSGALATSPALPHLAFDARLLGLGSSIKAVEAQKRENTGFTRFFPPHHLEALFGTANPPVGGLDVYPVADLLARDPRGQDGVRDQIEMLRALLKTRRGPLTPLDQMPFLPRLYEGQVLHAAVQYLDFPGVRGVRFLAGFISPGEVAPLGRRNVFYTFQGLSNDGKYYLSFQYSVALRELPVDAYAGANRRVMDALLAGKDAGAEWKASLMRTAQLLNALQNNPRLTRLDAFLRTVRLN